MVAKAAINITAYGTTGDGVANDATEIQNAYNGAPTAGSMVYHPRGHYLIGTTGLQIPASGTNGFSKALLLVGDGEGTVGGPGGIAGGATVIEYTGTGAALDAQQGGDSGTEGQFSRWMGGIHAIAFHGASAGGSSVGVLTGDILDADFYRLRTRGFQDGMRVEGDLYYCTFIKSRFTNAGRDGFSVGDPAGTTDSEVNGATWLSCIFHSNGRYGLGLSPNANKWLGQPCYILYSYCEKNGLEGYHLRKCRALYVVGGYIEGNNQDTVAGVGQIYYEADITTGANGNVFVLRDTYFNLSISEVAAGSPVVAVDIPTGTDNCTIHVEGCNTLAKDSNTVLIKENSAWAIPISLTAISNVLIDETDTCALTDAALMGDFVSLVAINDDWAANTTFPVSGSGNRNVAFPSFAAAA